MQISGPNTDKQYREHIKEGCPTNSDGKAICVCCGKRLALTWTDLHGQARCISCGISYAAITTYPNESALEKLGLVKGDVTLPYCDVFPVLPVYQAYWYETETKAPGGRYLGNPPDTADAVWKFIEWMQKHVKQLRPLYEDAWNWKDLLSEKRETI